MSTDLAIVIPARGGSTGVQRKNLQVVGGSSLVARAVATAVSADVGDVHCSTDDDEVAEAAVSAGGEHVRLRFRPAHLSTAEASSEEAVLDALRNAARLYTFVIMMQCTSPFTRPSDVKHVAEQLRKGGVDSVVSVVEFHGFLWRCDEPLALMGSPLCHDADKQRVRRQDAHGTYVENGALYGMRVSELTRTGNRFGERVQLYPMPPYRSIEVDDLWDLDVAKRMCGWPADRGA